MVKRKVTLNELKTNKKLKLDKVRRETKDIESLFDNIKKGTTIVDDKPTLVNMKKVISNSASHCSSSGIISRSKCLNVSSSSSLVSTVEEDRVYGIISSRIRPVIVNPEAPLERIDVESGLPVYKAHLLKVGEGGGTMLILIIIGGS